MPAPRRALIAALALATAAPLALLVTPATAQTAPGSAPLTAEVIRTAYGVPHVRADGYESLGAGVGYAAAEDGICDIADRMMTIRGERSRFLGPAGGNLESDLYHRSLIASGERQRLLDGPVGSPQTPSDDARGLVRGYVKGINSYLDEVGAEGIDDPRCAGQPWVVRTTEDTYWDSVYASPLPVQVAGVATAQPPAGPAAAQVAPDDVSVPADQVGSNAYGLGAEATRNGRGALLANPHYPWDGQLRFVRLHTTIPGEMDVVGAGLIGTPFVGIGHNASMAWSHTVSTARRSGYFELDLADGDPTAYVYDGVTTAMSRTPVTVEVRQPDGSLAPVTRTLYGTRFGPMVSTGTFPWTADRGFALRTASDGLRSVDQYLAIAKAEDVGELRAALGRYQATGYNTTASDAGGNAFFGDMGSIPHVTDAKVVECATSELARAQWAGSRTPVLDGSRPECQWGNDPDAVQPGVFGVSALPQLVRRDYVTQSNDSHWLSNPKQPLVGYPLIFGEEQTTRSLRTRLGLLQVEQRIAGTDGLAGEDGFDLSTIQQVLFGNRNYGAELTRDALVELCDDEAVADPSLAEACDALRDWDLRVDVDSRGAHVFRLFAANGGLRFTVPFDSADPVNTPNTLDTADPRTIGALRTAVTTLRDAGIALDATWGSVHTEPRGDRRIPMHGGLGGEGIFNVVTAIGFTPQLGWTNVVTGASWIMAVEFTDDGPLSEGVLTYSQSANPNSPHFADQTDLFSREGWDDLRFAREEVLAGAQRTYLVSVPAGPTCSATGRQCIDLERLAGVDRYGTAAAIAVASFEEAETVLLARGDVFADALTANHLAGVLGAPVLLTDPAALPTATSEALELLGATDVVIVGGVAAVSSAVEADLENDYEVERIGGDDRYRTAALLGVAAELQPGDVGELDGLRTAVLGSGQDFPDVLSAGALGYSQRFPMMITMPGELPAATEQALRELAVEQVIIVGGRSAVSPAVQAEVEAIVGAPAVRLDGTGDPTNAVFDRYATARDVADFAYDVLGYDATHVNVARGDDFADALAGGPHAGAERGPIVLTLPTTVPPATEALLQDRCSTLRTGHVLGGTAAVSDAVVTALGRERCAGDIG